MNFKFYAVQLWERFQYLFRHYRGRVSLEKLGIWKEDYLESVALNFPEYQVKSNMWGTFKLKTGLPVYAAIKSDGWYFRAPSKNTGVIGYPSITFDDTAIKVKDIFNYTAQYTSLLSVEKYRKFNTSFDFWVGKGTEFSFPVVTHEIMVWDNYFVAFPFGKFKEEVKIGEHLYRVYMGFIDKSEENLGVDGWHYTAFLRVNRGESNTLDVKRVLDYLVEEKVIDADSHLLRSEFGNEVYNATGKMEILEFSCTLNSQKRHLINFYDE